MGSGDEVEKEIQRLFVAEALDFLGRCESALLLLESDPANSSALEELFRLMHNLKGGGKAVGFESVAEICHQVENLLVSFRAGKSTVGPPAVSLLLECLDALRAELGKGPSGSGDKTGVVGRLLERLLKAAESQQEERAAPAAVSPAGAREVPASGAGRTREQVPATDETVRVSLRKIEDILNGFGEQVILQATLEHVKYDIEENRELLLRTINQLSKLTLDLQQTTLALRMVSLRGVFSKMERVARDAARSAERQVRLVLEGQDSELDKGIVDALADPLTHMIRNAVDHGIESVEERLLADKDPVGTLRLCGERRGGVFRLTIEDDGRGLDRKRILEKAVEKGLVASGAELSDDEVFALIFRSGFSTRDTTTDLSGRGVGMDVVQEAIRALKGECRIFSKAGSGTRFVIDLPLSLAMFNGMVVRVGGSRYVLPSSDVERVVRLQEGMARRIDGNGGRLVEVGGEVLPLHSLSTRLRGPASPDGKGTIVIVCGGGRSVGLLVDEVVSLQRIVHKALGPEVQERVDCLAGATILGDGSPALILDIGAILATLGRVA